MKEKITIIEPSKGDLNGILLLLNDWIDEMEDSAGFDIQKAEWNCRELLDNSLSYFLVAKHARKVIGFINFTSRQTILHHAPSGTIDELIVHKTYRGLGTGKKLISAAVKKCKEIGCCELEVSTEKSNKKARAFYKKCGFKEDALLMELGLD